MSRAIVNADVRAPASREARVIATRTRREDPIVLTMYGPLGFIASATLDNEAADALARELDRRRRE